MEILSIDPGDVHCGMCLFELMNGKWEVEGWETDPEDCAQTVDLMVSRLNWLLVENFFLFPDQAMRQTRSTMPTAQLIGQIKWITRQRGCEDRLILLPPGVAGVKNVVEKFGVQPLKKGDHVHSAEMHGWRWIYQNPNKVNR